MSANLIHDDILTIGYKIIILDTKSQLPASGVTSVIYFIKVDESNTSKATSYIWSGSAFTKLSDRLTDIECHDTMSVFPTIGFAT